MLCRLGIKSAALHDLHPPFVSAALNKVGHAVPAAPAACSAYGLMLNTTQPMVHRQYFIEKGATMTLKHGSDALAGPTSF